jgi:hypothetical protein
VGQEQITVLRVREQHHQQRLHAQLTRATLLLLVRGDACLDVLNDSRTLDDIFDL